MDNHNVDVVIIGGGLAGLTAALHLRKAGKSVLVIEKKTYPQHKVCGEYISCEVLPYFEYLDAPLEALQANFVQRFRLHGPSGKYVESQLPLGGLGIRRYTLDHYLYEKALIAGVRFLLKTNVQAVSFSNGLHTLKSDHHTIKAPVVLGSFGKRSKMDKVLMRPFAQEPARYLGVKFYIDAPFPTDLVTLYNFDSGYAGAVQVEDGTIDIAYLVDAASLQKAGGVSQLEQKVLYQNPAIRELFESGPRSPAKPLAISNVSFLPKKQVIDHILLIGDAAGMIPPLAGNGMAMAIHGAKLAAECSLEYLSGQISREHLDLKYQQQWNQQFKHRLFWGRRLHRFMGKPLVSETAVQTLKVLPFLLRPIIRQTHGKPILISS